VAVDITSCGQSVPAREVGVLTADLVCDPGERGVTLTLSSTLDLNGHDIVAPDGWAVWCEPGRRCTVIGNGGEIRASKVGVYLQNRSDLWLSDVTIRDCEVGVLGEDWHNGRRGAKARLTNVFVIGSSEGLRRVTCDRAAMAAAPLNDWGVCRYDNP
jgi:hypothetical protein